MLAAGNIQRSKIGDTQLDASVDFFAIAVPSSDRLYSAEGEVASERVLTWPLSTGFNLGWQATPFQKATLQYQFRFDGYVKDRTTAENFVVPSSTVTNGIGGAWEYRRGGYSLLLNGTWFAPRHLGALGVPGAWARGGHDDLAATYAKYSAGLSRDFYLNPFHKIHLNAAWFGGRDLDRFAKYQFGMFDDTRIHGVPASGVRFGELAMVRGSYSINIFDQYRFDLFLDQAWGRDDPATAPGSRSPGSASRSTCARRGIRFCASISARACCRRATTARLDDAADHAAEAAPMTPTLRADLHVHTCHSKVSGTLPFLGSRDCYSPPADVYRVAKARGMDLVAFTDHDSIDGALELLDARGPIATDVIVGEEVSCRLPDGDIEVHLGVYGMTEALHRDVQPLRRNVFDVTARAAAGRRVLRAEPPAALLSRADSARPVSAAARRGPGARGAKRHDAAGAQCARRADRRRGGRRRAPAGSA